MTVDFVCIVRAKHARVRRDGAGRFLCRHLLQDFVQGCLHSLQARLREVGQIAFRRRAREIELGDPGAQAFEMRAGLLDRFLRVGGILERGHRVVEDAQIPAQHGLQRPNLVVERRLPVGDCGPQFGRALGGGRELAGHDRGPCVELGGCFLESLHFDGERRRPLHQRGVRGAGVGGLPVDILRGFPRLEQAALRQRQALVRRALVAIEPLDRAARASAWRPSSVSRSSSACRRSRTSCSAFC